MTASNETTSVDPPASSLVNFDAANAKMVFSENNVSLISTGGILSISIRDENTGQLLGAKTFPYVINDKVATFENPTEVTNWVQSFSGYDGDVKVSFNAQQLLSSPPPGESGQLTTIVKYADMPYASGSGYVHRPPAGHGPNCPPVCPVQRGEQTAPVPGSS